MNSLVQNTRLDIYRRIVDHFARTHPLYTRSGIRYPLVVFRPDAAQQADVDSVLGTLSGTFEDPAAFAFHDKAHLERLQQAGRRLENKPTFTFNRLDQGPLKVHGHLGMYFDMMATCDALEYETRGYFQRHATLDDARLLPHRFHLHQMISPEHALTSGQGRSATLGVAVLTVFNDRGTYKAILAQRSQHTATEPGFYHVLPAFVLQPSAALNPAEWSVSYHIYREVLEELFGVPETDMLDGADRVYAHPQIQSLRTPGRAALYLTGVSLNLLTLRAEICALLLIHDPDWYAQTDSFHAAWETERRSMVVAPITDDARLLAALPEGVRDTLYANMTPPGSAALWLGVDSARSLIAPQTLP